MKRTETRTRKSRWILPPAITRFLITATRYMKWQMEVMPHATETNSSAHAVAGGRVSGETQRALESRIWNQLTPQIRTVGGSLLAKR